MQQIQRQRRSPQGGAISEESEKSHTKTRWYDPGGNDRDLASYQHYACDGDGFPKFCNEDLHSYAKASAGTDRNG